MTVAHRNSSPNGSDLKIAVLGLGHVGLPTALELSALGRKVIGVDTDTSKVAAIAEGKCPFFEPGLQQLLSEQNASGNFELTTDLDGAIRAATVIFICVGTPQRPSGEADLTYIEEVAVHIAANLNGYKLIVEKSTVPAITGQWIRRTIERYARLRKFRPTRNNGHSNGNNGNNGHKVVTLEAEAAIAGAEFDVASNPEFLQEGKALENIRKPARIVCGVDSERAKMILADLYRESPCPILFTDLNTSELIKHTANAFLATKISFINMISDLCEAVGADVEEVALGIGLDPRIGKDFLSAGIGFGGYCLPKDLRALHYLGSRHNVDLRLLREVERINQLRTEVFLNKVRQALWVLRGKTIAVLGLAFKAGTDDLREAPSISIIQTLLAEGAAVRLYDHAALEGARQAVPDQPGRVVYCASPYEAAQEAHALLFLTEDESFRALDYERLSAVMQTPILLDGRNVLDPAKVRASGFEYWCMGRPKQQSDRFTSDTTVPLSADSVSAAS